MEGKFFLLAIGGEWLLSVIDDCVSMVTECQDVFLAFVFCPCEAQRHKTMARRPSAFEKVFSQGLRT